MMVCHVCMYVCMFGDNGDFLFHELPHNWHITCLWIDLKFLNKNLLFYLCNVCTENPTRIHTHDIICYVRIHTQFDVLFVTDIV